MSDRTPRELPEGSDPKPLNAAAHPDHPLRLPRLFGDAEAAAEEQPPLRSAGALDATEPPGDLRAQPEPSQPDGIPDPTGEPDDVEALRFEASPDPRPALTGRRRQPRSRRMVKAEQAVPPPSLTPQQKLLILDTWLRSKLPAKDFAAMVGISPPTLYAWRKRFNEDGPAGLQGAVKGRPRGSRLPEPTRRAILMMKEQHPDWGCDRVHDMLLRSDGYQASPGAIQRLLEEEGYVVEHPPTRPHPDKVRRFERARPNQLWQSDLFSFVLKRQNRRLHLVIFMDDHSRFVTGYGLHASASGALVREVLEAAIANFGAPEEVLTDNGTQYQTWRGKSAFTRLLDRRGVKHIVARPRHPETLGKCERFWGSLWRECLQEAVFRDLADARIRIGLFIDHYNFCRTHQGIDGLVPADRFFQAAPQVLETLRKRVQENAADLARHGLPRKNFYLTGRVGDVGISLHAEGDRVILTSPDGSREEVDLAAPGRRAEPGEEPVLPAPLATHAAPPAEPGTDEDNVDTPPGASPLDVVVEAMEDDIQVVDDPDEAGEAPDAGGQP